MSLLRLWRSRAAHGKHASAWRQNAATRSHRATAGCFIRSTSRPWAGVEVSRLRWRLRSCDEEQV